jgi:hypothetical protein
MSDTLDKLGDLAHHAVDIITGAISRTSAPSKPAATVIDASHHLGSGAAQQTADAVSGRQKQIDDAVDSAS